MHGDTVRRKGWEVVARADPVDENRARFTESFAVPAGYADYRQMLDTECLDIVSVCTYPSMHREMVVAAASSGVKAVFAEKSMAPHHRLVPLTGPLHACAWFRPRWRRDPMR